MILLGQKVRDVVTGAIGIAVGRTEWLNGCVRWMIQPQVDKEGKGPGHVPTIALPGRMLAAPRTGGGGRPNPSLPAPPTR